MTEATGFRLPDETLEKLNAIIEEMQSVTRFEVNQTNMMKMLIDIAHSSKIHLKGEPSPDTCRLVLDVSEQAADNLNRSATEANMSPDVLIDIVLRQLLGGTKHEADK